MYTASNLRKGLKVVIDNDPYMVTFFEFSKPGKGQALYRTKLRNMITGLTLDRTFREGDAFEPASLQTVARIHSPAYFHEVGDFATRRGGYIESDTVVSHRSFDAACKAAGAVCDTIVSTVSRLTTDYDMGRPFTSAQVSSLANKTIGFSEATKRSVQFEDRMEDRY